MTISTLPWRQVSPTGRYAAMSLQECQDALRALGWEIAERTELDDFYMADTLFTARRAGYSSGCPETLDQARALVQMLTIRQQIAQDGYDALFDWLLFLLDEYRKGTRAFTSREAHTLAFVGYRLVVTGAGGMELVALRPQGSPVCEQATPLPGADAWKEQIPKVAKGNVFSSNNADLFFCKVGSSLPLETEEHYERAKLVVASSPHTFRILRYEGDTWKPCLYGVYTRIDPDDYVLTGATPFPVDPSTR